MKKSLSLLLCMLVTAGVFAQKKVCIINFSIDGKDRMASMSDMEGKEPSELYFIGDNSSRLSDTVRTSDEIVKLTEKMLKDYVGAELVPVNLDRPQTVPDQMNGALWVMETITEKAAFSKLNYDEAVVISSRIYSAGKANKGYRPVMEISLKWIGKDGKAKFKKTEKLKLKDVYIEEKLVVQKEDDSGLLSINFSKSKTTEEKKEYNGNAAGEGVPAIQVLDWYKQCLTNLLITD